MVRRGIIKAANEPLSLCEVSEDNMSRFYLTVILLSFLIGLATAIGIWGHAACGGDEFILARFLTTFAVMGIGHCFYKLLFGTRRAIRRHSQAVRVRSTAAARNRGDSP